MWIENEFFYKPINTAKNWWFWVNQVQNPCTTIIWIIGEKKKRNISNVTLVVEKKCSRISYHTGIRPPKFLELKMTVAKKEDLFSKTNDSCCRNLRVGHIHLYFFFVPLIKHDVNDYYMWAYKMCEKKEKNKS